VRVLVTRAREQAGPWLIELRALGAVPVELPCVAIVPAADMAPLRRALAAASAYDGVIFTSANAVTAVARELAAAGASFAALPLALATARVCAVGPATAALLASLGRPPHLLPARHHAHGLLAVLAADSLAGRRFLLPRAEQGRELLAEGLAAAGARVDAVVAYRTLCPDPADLPSLAIARAGRFDVATFASPSAVSNFLSLVGEETGRKVLGAALVVAIGGTTATALRERGLRVDGMAREQSTRGLTAAIAELLPRPDTR
jgi:uroporphyrinogen III methyltransferase/synthase